MFELLGISKITIGGGPDRLSASILRHTAVALTDVSAFLINTSLTLSSIPNYQRPVTVVPIPINWQAFAKDQTLLSHPLDVYRN